MIQSIRNLPLAARLSLIAVVFVINYFFFSTIAAFIVTPFAGYEKVVDVMEGKIVTTADKFIFLFIQGVGSLGIFAFTALLFSQLEAGLVAKRLALNVMPGIKFIVLAVLAVLAAQGLIQFIVEMNQKIPLPAGLGFLDQMGKESEKITDILMAGKSPTMFLINTLVFALIPAIGEEFFFRGLLLGELLQSKVSPAVAIFLTGLIFAVVHLEFNNLLAIWLLGSFLGYLYYVSGSIWVPVAAHFTNNFLDVLFKYLYNSGYLGKDISEAEFPLYAVFISAALFALCLFIFNRWNRQIDFSTQLSAPMFLDEEMDETETEY